MITITLHQLSSDKNDIQANNDSGRDSGKFMNDMNIGGAVIAGSNLRCCYGNICCRGGSLAAYKMKRRISGLTELEINKEYYTPQHVSDSSSDDDDNYLNENISKK
jgi:hypothetical protein